MRTFIPSILLTLCLSAASPPLNAAPNAPTTYSVIDVNNGGQVHGTVTYSGGVPSPENFRVTRDAKAVCGAEKQRQSIVVNGAKLQGVIIVIKGIHQGKEFGEAPTLNIQQCELVPRVQAMASGQRLTLKNHDDMPHRVTGQLGSEVIFDFFQPVQGSKHRKKLHELGAVQIHGDPDMPWATAWIQVVPHPYFAVSDQKGRFSLEDIPPGHYELMAWHETLGVRSMGITIVEGKTLNLSITFKSEDLAE